MHIFAYNHTYVLFATNRTYLMLQVDIGEARRAH